MKLGPWCTVGSEGVEQPLSLLGALAKQRSYLMSQALFDELEVTGDVLLVWSGHQQLGAY